tara:strand:- start:107 stop:283 length:177 start_codon:yes stop_codon:yes gene_type:complete
MDGNKKKIKTDMVLKRAVTPDGELTTLEDPVVTVTLSKIPAELAAISKAIIKKIAAYI